MLRSLYGVWSHGFDMLDILFILLSYAALIFVMLPLHELAHAFAAEKLGDNTAKWNGRLTLNPLRHLDVIGTVMMLLVGFGYAKPVPVNPYNFRKPKRDMALTALAGPLSNLLMAILSVGIFRVILLLTGGYTVANGDIYAANPAMISVLKYAYLILIQIFASVNITLAVFNLLPIPPLDGSRIFAAILPDKWNYTLQRYEQYISIGLMLLLFMGWLDTPLYFLHRGAGFLICGLFGMPNIFKRLLSIGRN